MPTPATLIYNASAGSTNQATPEELLAALQTAGYAPVHPSTNSEEELDTVLRNVRGLVVAAGGDGTIRAVAKRLLGQSVALTILPMGTMNNVALTLGLSQPPLEIITGLQNPVKRPFDVGRVRGVWGEEIFLEGAGIGFFADLLLNFRPDEEKSLLRAATSLLKTLVNFPNYPCRIHLDDQTTNAQEVVDDFVMVEILNTSSMGPRLRFAPNADPSDGLLDLVQIHASEEASFLQYVRTLLTDELHVLPNVEVRQVRKVELELADYPVHIDDQLRPDPKQQVASPPALADEQIPASLSTVTIEVLPHALEVWLPSAINQPGTA